MMLSVMLMTYETTAWMMSLAEPTVTQSGFCSIVFGCFSATFAVWLNHEK
jgi:ABC-type phosphate transport system permease subunit